MSRTASGSPCKLCSKKGEICHIHKTQKSKSPKFEYFLNLPKPVLYEVLLNMNPEDLKSILRVPEVISLVRLPEFQRLYDIKHKINSFTLGKRKINEENLFIKGRDDIDLVISKGNPLVIIVRSHTPPAKMGTRKRTQLNFLIIFRFDETNKVSKFSIVNNKNEGLIWDRKERDWVLESNNSRIVYSQLLKLFTTRKKLEWMPDEFGEINQDSPREIFESIKTILNKSGIAYDVVWH